MVWSYCGLYKNNRAEYQPLALVAFREHNDGWVSDQIKFRRVPLTTLGQLRIGTIWRSNVQVATVVFDEAFFTVSYDRGRWCCNSFQRALHQDQAPPYPQELYPLHIRADRNEHLILELANENRLVIPCLEFFSRMYGRSEEIKRVLATFPWSNIEGAEDNRLYGESPATKTSREWVVNLRTRIRDTDAVFLAHAKYESFTRNAAKNIYAQIESQHDPDGKVPAFIQVSPWFEGTARIKVQGVWFNDSQSFLGLRIVGSSDPEGPAINIDRTNTNRTVEPASKENTDKAWAGASSHRDMNSTEPLTITGEVEPDHGATNTETKDDGFETLGTSRIVKPISHGRAKSASASRVSQESEGNYSSGEAHSTDKNTGYVAQYAPQILESSGTLRDMWNAALFLNQIEPELIESVRSFTFDNGYSSHPEPHGIAFKVFGSNAVSNDSSSISGGVRSWQYLDRSNHTIRGLLVINLQCRGSSVHIVEIQRRQKTHVEGERTRTTKESFRGVVMILEDDDLLPNWLANFLDQASFKKGVVGDLIRLVPGTAAAFKHATAASERIPCEAAMINALSKVGIVR